jgi:hypothetical protein
MKRERQHRICLLFRELSELTEFTEAPVVPNGSRRRELSVKEVHYATSWVHGVSVDKRGDFARDRFVIDLFVTVAALLYPAL